MRATPTDEDAASEDARPHAPSDDRATRTLIYVPVVHSEADLGTLAAEVRQRFQEAFGGQGWARRNATIEALWAELKEKVLGLPISWERTRIYQDGLPVCGREREIVREVAAAGSQNHQLVEELIARGATLMGTESPELMLQEYARIQQLLQVAREPAGESVPQELAQRGVALLRARDAFIAERIDATLAPGETGLLFLGLTHRVDEILEGKVETRRAIHSLPLGGDPRWGRRRSGDMEMETAKRGTKDRERSDVASFRVVEALAKDVGRGLVRLDPKDLGRLGVEVGEIVEIAGERATVAKAMPAYADSRGKQLIQMDGITRHNAKVGLDQRVSVRKVQPNPASKIVLRPLDRLRAFQNGGDSRYIGRLLEGLSLVSGDRVRAPLFGARHQDFEALATHPKTGAVLIHPQTQVVIEGEPESQAKAAGISYEDVGGLRKEIRRVREMIELPLRFPQLFHRLGIDPPRGVLLHGPPGTGKTLLARAVAHETEAAFLSVSGPEVIHKFYGESEAKLRGIFEQARKNAPCIVFLDELDAIAPKRENVQGEVEKRVVAQLLALMDGIDGRGQIIVIGATNLPNVLDPALRRPGRFDREIEIGIPDAGARREILEVHTRGMPLDVDVDIGRLAATTHGFVGADLESLCREAAMTALRGVMPAIDFSREEVPDETLLTLKVTMDNFERARTEIEPSAIREVFVEVPDVAWDDVGGLAAIKRELREAVEWPLKVPALLQRAGVCPAKGILLYGAPGTGKTLLAKAVASQSGVNFISVKGPQLLSKFVGESEKGVRELFKKARQAAPCILFFDEIDALAPPRSAAAADAGVSQRVISQLLTEMDGIEELKGVLVIAATNRKDMLDPALLRPGRFDLLLEVPPPDAAARREIFAVHSKNRPMAADIHWHELVEKTDGATGAELEAICHRAALHAARELVETQGEEADPCALTITSRHLHAVLDEIRRGVGF